MRFGRMLWRAINGAPKTAPIEIAPWVESDQAYRVRILERVAVLRNRVILAGPHQLDRYGTMLNLPREEGGKRETQAKRTGGPR